MNPPNYSSCAEGRKLWFAVRHLASLVLAGWATCVSLGAAADINDYLGLPIVDVNLDFGGAVPTPGSEELIVTSVGIPLSMTDVRESIWHLFSLGYYSDIRVDASLRDGGVVLLYELIPIKVVDRLAFRGDLGLSGGDLREAIGERYGDRPQLGQVDDIAVFLRELYRDQGYLNTSIAISPLDRGGGLITLTIEIAAGEQARLATLVINGQVLETEASIFRRLDLRIGGHFDRGALEQRLADYVNNLKQDGHFEAVAGHTVEARPGGLQLDLTLTVDAGPRVLVEFEGDSLPVEIQDALVTVDRESSVDEDLLEDSNRRLLDYLRQRGFRRAITDYSRTGDDLELKIVYHVDRGPVVWVGGIEIEGYQVFSPAVLEDRLGVVIGDPFVEAALDEGVTAILAIYREVGYPEARVATEVIEESSPSGPIVHLRLTVTEGLRMVIGSIVIEGAPSSVVSRLQAVMTAHSGDVYERSVALVDRDAILQQLLSLGYETANVRVDASFDPDTRQAHLTHVVEAGQQILVDHVLITGQFRVSTATIRREITLVPGQPLSRDRLTESRRRLGALGLFRRIRITEISHGSDTRRDVLVTVEEVPATTLGYGGGFEAGTRLRRGREESGAAVEQIEFAPRGFFEIGRRNLWGKNRSVNLFTRVSLRPDNDQTINEDSSKFGFNEYRVLATFREPRAFGSAGELLFSTFIEQSIRSSFNLKQRGVRVEWRRPLGSTTLFTGGYTFNRDQLFDERFNVEEERLIDRLFPGIALSTFSGALIRDNRDDPFDPTRGELVSVDAGLAGRAIGSKVGFAKTLMQGFFYRRLPGIPSVVFATGLRVGLATGFSRPVNVIDKDGNPVLTSNGLPVETVLRDVPASERFFAGGSTTVRGFALDRLGDDSTIDQDGFPQGGNGLIIINNELRLSIWESLGAVAFLDVGNVFKTVDRMKFSGLSGGAGFGLRYRSPIGPIRLDLGFKLDRRDFSGGTRESLMALHVSIGQAF